jgi:RIO kinase 1
MPKEEMALRSLNSFCDEGLITEVLGIVKSGKEATVYCCRAAPSSGAELLAAKVYRPRRFRTFKDDAVYQDGRVILDARFRRAVRRKTRTGRGVQSGLWVSSEFETLTLLWEAGADVPKPIARSGSAILMEYVGDGESAAPMLNRVCLPWSEARPLFDLLLRNVELWLACNLVHADLSPFNILYWKGGIKVIDFPQAVDARFNRNAFALLRRDVDNVCRHFAKYGVRADPSRLAGDLWNSYLRAEL